MLAVTTDSWLSDVLRHGDLTDAGVTRELAATFATRDPSVDAHGTVTLALLDALEETWERGWQPADVVHVVLRGATAGSVPLVVALISEHARRSDAVHRAPDAWIDQLSDLGALEAGEPAVVDAWRRAERLAPEEAWRIVLRLAGTLRNTLRIDTLLPPPSRWGVRRTGASGTAPHGDDRALRRIRGLLTKAESTDFPDEAESLTAKAQELMTRYAIDAALLDVGPSPTGAVGVETRRVHVQEPYVRAQVIVPKDYVGAVMELCTERRGRFDHMEYLSEARVLLSYELPLGEIVIDFYDQLKSRTRGYASFDYDLAGFRDGNLARVDVLVAGEQVDALSLIIHRDFAYERGKLLVERLRKEIPRQFFDVPIQAAIGARIIARETVKAKRKDVLAKCYGGDISRKRKLLEKQKKGKKRMKQVGGVEVPQEAFLAVLNLDERSK